ncbi:MAG: FtsX-like permease family protein [Acetatifactor sp.]|nr:FtsX-like permease family protein [Acetatifactor sp.]
MQRILSKRVLRDIRENLLRYLALFFLVALVMYMVVAIVGAAETIMQGTKESGRLHHREDGQFGVFVPLTDDEIAQITEKGVTLQRDFSLDFHLGQSTLRVYRARETVDLFVPSQGSEVPAQGEILLEQHYAEKHELGLGDSLTVGGRDFTVTGIGSTPDYDAAYEKTSDTTVDSNLFGVGFVTAEDYEALKAGGENFRTEDYTYTYLLNDAMTDQELKDMLQSFELDRSKVTDTYFLEMLADAEETKNDIQDGIRELLDGVNELADGVDELAEHNAELTDAADTLFDAMLEQVNDSLKDAGVEVTLTSSNYEQQLNNMIANPHAYTASIRQDLQDAKKSLEELQEYKDGIKAYTDGVNAASDGSGKLVVGMGQITANSDDLNQGADAIFNAIMGMVNEQLKAQLGPYAAYGIAFSGLTADGYGKELDQMAATFTQMGASQVAAQLSAVKSQLDTVAQFRDGVKAYTKGVGEASIGNQQLFCGLSTLYTASEPLVSGTDAVVDALMDMVEAQLEESDISVDLTADNYKEELERLTAEGSSVDVKLKDSLKDAKDTLADLEDFREGIIDYTDAVDEIADGSRELRDGVQELQDETDDMIEEYFTFDIDNLTQFLIAADNPRMDAAAGDVIINRFAGILAGIILMVLFTYVISVFVIHNIEKESSVIGALYALGVTRGQLLFHYLLNPMLIAFLGGVVGCILGFSKYGTGWQMGDSIAYYSLPPMRIVTPGYLLFYSLIMPPVTAVVVNYLVINKKLKCTALSLLRNEQTAGKAGRIQNMNLGDMKFLLRFQIRQMLREIRSAFAVVIGMFICLLILMMSIDCAVLCINFGNACLEETKYAYMYTYKYPTEDVPEGGTPAYVENLKKEAYGYNLDVTVLGIDDGNPYFPIVTADKKNEIVISSAAAQKFGVKVGDKLVLSDEVNERDYAFTVKDIVSFTSGVYVFLDRDIMQELFDQEDDYYNVVFADHALDIDNGRLYATVSKENVEESSQIFTDMMGPMVVMLVAISVLIFMIVMYLMMKVMIDRSAFSISLMKVFGYRRREIRRLYLDGNFYVILLGALICVPLAKWSMDLVYPYCIANVAIGMDLKFTPQIYIMIYGGILLCYMVINFLLVGRLNKLVPAEVLKNRE